MNQYYITGPPGLGKHVNPLVAAVSPGQFTEINIICHLPPNISTSSGFRIFLHFFFFCILVTFTHLNAGYIVFRIFQEENKNARDDYVIEYTPASLLNAEGL